MKEVHPYISHVTWGIIVAYAPCCFMSLIFQKKEVYFSCGGPVQYYEGLWEHFFCRLLVFHYEYNFMALFFTSVCIE